MRATLLPQIIWNTLQLKKLFPVFQHIHLNVENILLKGEGGGGHADPNKKM